MEYSENAVKVYNKLYLRGEEESYIQCHERVSEFASLGNKRLKEKIKYYLDNQFVRFNSPCMMNSGISEFPQTSACYSGLIKDDLISIFDFDRDCGLVYKEGSGMGINWGHLRETGAPLSKGGNSSGIFAFIHKAASTCWAVKSGGVSRRAAFMSMLFDWHPDLIKFITFKEDHKEEYIFLPDGRKEELFSCMNFSVAISKNFMNAVEKDLDWELIGVVDKKVKEKYKARDIFDLIINNAFICGDPGVWFIDRANDDNTLPSIGKYSQTNPCLVGDTYLFDGDRLTKVKNQGKLFSSWKTGNKKTIMLHLSNGKKIQLTSDHLVKLDNGEDLPAAHTTGCSIQDIFENRFYDGEIIKDKRVENLGFLYGDGFICGGDYGISTKVNKEKEPDVFNRLLEFGMYEQKCGSLYLNIKKMDIEEIEIGLISQCCGFKKLPDKIMEKDVHYLASFLCGLFSANGTMLAGKGNRVCIRDSSRDLIGQIQILLSLFGIRSYITTNKSKDIEWNNGVYKSKQSYDINISDYESISRFKKYIGFIEGWKNDRVDLVLKTKKKGRKVYPKVVKIERCGIEEVYDFTMNDGIPYNNANGIIVHNCSEQVLHPYQSCALASINLGKCVDDNGNVNYQIIEDITETLTESLDNMIDISGYPTDNFKDMAIKTRGIGIGPMAVADFLIGIGLKYNSSSAYLLMEKICKYITKTSINTSSRIAREKGVFELYEKNKDSVLSVYKKFFDLDDKNDYFDFDNVSKYGVRNSHVTTVAPNGTTGPSCDCSPGMEPLFGICYDKLISDSNGEVWTFVNPLFEDRYKNEKWYPEAIKLIAKNHGSCQGIDIVPKEVQELFVVAHDIHWKDRIEMQSHMQNGISNAISSTINLPNSATKEEIAEIYKLSYEKNLKGVTVYRDGSKSNQPVSFGQKECKEEIIIPDKYVRPIRSDADHFEYDTNIGSMHVTICKDNNGKIFQILIRLGKQGSLTNLLLDAMSRCVSKALQYNVPIEVFAKTLRDNKDSPFWVRLAEGDERTTQVESVVDLLGIIFDIIAKEKYEIRNDVEIKNGYIKMEKCPVCGEHSILRDGSCKNGRCTNEKCLYTSCG